MNDSGYMPCDRMMRTDAIVKRENTEIKTTRRFTLNGNEALDLVDAPDVLIRQSQRKKRVGEAHYREYLCK
jgi:hypothetical protein